MESSVLELAHSQVSEALWSLVAAADRKKVCAVPVRDLLRGSQWLSYCERILRFFWRDAEVWIGGHYVIMVLPLVLADLLRVLQQRDGHGISPVALPQEVEALVQRLVL